MINSMNSSNYRAKIRKIGNSLGIIIPANVITSYKEGDEIEFNVITSGNKQGNKDKNVITSNKNNKSNVITSNADKKQWVFNIKKGIYE